MKSRAKAVLETIENLLAAVADNFAEPDAAIHVSKESAFAQAAGWAWATMVGSRRCAKLLLLRPPRGGYRCAMPESTPGMID